MIDVQPVFVCARRDRGPPTVRAETLEREGAALFEVGAYVLAELLAMRGPDRLGVARLFVRMRLKICSRVGTIALLHKKLETIQDPAVHTREW